MTYMPAPAHGDCPSGKWQYADRRQARAARRRMADSSLNVYRCPACAWLHVGHQPQAVRNGTLDKRDWLDTRGNR